MSGGTNSSFAIGDTGPAGGIVFYVDPGDASKGLEAAREDAGRVQWGCISSRISATFRDADSIGTGATNTQAIIAAGCSVAAQVANDYTVGGFSDWFLPSKDELDAMRLNIGPGCDAMTNPACMNVSDL